MFNRSTISHVTSEWESYLEWLNANSEASMARDYYEIDRGGPGRMAEERAEGHG